MSHVAVGCSFRPRACRTDRLMYIIRCGSFLELAGIVRGRWLQIFLRPGRFAGQIETFSAIFCPTSDPLSEVF